MVIGHVLPEKDASLLEAYEKCRALADPKACCDYALHVGVTWWGPKVRTHVLRIPPYPGNKLAETHSDPTADVGVGSQRQSDGISPGIFSEMQA